MYDQPHEKQKSFLCVVMKSSVLCRTGDDSFTERIDSSEKQKRTFLRCRFDLFCAAAFNYSVFRLGSLILFPNDVELVLCMCTYE